MEKIKIPNSKGKNIAAVIHYPEKPTDRLAILCPGYLDSKDYKHMVGLAEALSKKEYTVIRFDPTGTWESEGDIYEYTTTQCLLDIKSIIDYLSPRGVFTCLLLGGHSRGGMISILYAAHNPRVSAVLAIMPSSPYSMSGKNRDEWQKNGFSLSQRNIPDRNEKKEFRVPYSHAQDNDQYNVIDDVKMVKVPIVFLAGTLDEVVLPENVKRIFNNANEPKKYILMEGIGHDYRYNQSEVEAVNNKILEALSEIL